MTQCRASVPPHRNDGRRDVVVAVVGCQQRVTSLRSCSVSSVTRSWQRWTAPVAVV